MSFAEKYIKRWGHISTMARIVSCQDIERVSNQIKIQLSQVISEIIALNDQTTAKGLTELPSQEKLNDVLTDLLDIRFRLMFLEDIVSFIRQNENKST